MRASTRVGWVWRRCSSGDARRRALLGGLAWLEALFVFAEQPGFRWFEHEQLDGHVGAAVHLAHVGDHAPAGGALDDPGELAAQMLRQLYQQVRYLLPALYDMFA